MADAPLALTEVAAAVHDGRIWVAGGLDDAGRATDRVFVYEPATDAWAEATPLPRPVHHAALVSDGPGLSLIGGYDGDGFSRPSATAWRTEDPDAVRWERAESLPEPRAACAAGWDGRGAVVYGGGVGPNGVSGDVFVLEAGGWRRVASLSRPREHLAADGRSGYVPPKRVHPPWPSGSDT